jgi:prolyl 4-hydroxylase
MENFSIEEKIKLKKEKEESERKLKINIISIYDKIKLKYIENFLTTNECEHMVYMSDEYFNRSLVLINGKQVASDIRTSFTHFIPVPYDNITKKIEKKTIKCLDEIIGKNNVKYNVERMQIVKYETGQEFKEHYDFVYGPFTKNQRLYTFFVYLNDVDEGGETFFPLIDKKILPKQKSAAFWENHNGDGCNHLDSIHCGKAPTKGKKYGLNIWIGICDNP